jgi:hypothetical protein
VGLKAHFGALVAEIFTPTRRPISMPFLLRA